MYVSSLASFEVKDLITLAKDAGGSRHVIVSSIDRGAYLFKPPYLSLGRRSR